MRYSKPSNPSHLLTCLLSSSAEPGCSVQDSLLAWPQERLSGGGVGGGGGAGGASAWGLLSRRCLLSALIQREAVKNQAR